MAKTLQIPKSQAIDLFVALGFKTARKWDCKKLTEKINSITEAPDEPLETEELDDLLDKLMEAEETEVVDDEEPEEDEEDAPDDDDKIDDDGDEPVEDEDDLEVDGDEEVKPKKNKKDKKGKDKEEKKAKKEKKTTRTKGKSIDSTTLELLKKKPMSLESLHAALVKEFPDSDADTLLRTTKRRLTGHLQNKYDVTIVKSKKGAYSIQ